MSENRRRDATLASAMVEVEYDPFAEHALEQVVPTTEAQREVWLAAQLSEGASLAFNESSSIELRGRLDATVLRLALNDLLARHSLLRATVSPNGLELCIGAELNLDVPLIDLSAMAVEQSDAALARHLASEVETAFDLARGPLIRTTLLKLAGDVHRLVITAHHLVCDGWSFGVMAEDLAALYTARYTGQAHALPDASQYRDYVQAETDGMPQSQVQADEAYWMGRFKAEAPVLELPCDRARPALRSFASRRHDTLIDAALVAGLKRLGGKAGASLFGVLLSGFALLMGRLAGQSEVVIGVPAAGQSATGMTELVGHCVNLLPVRASIAPDAPMLEFVRGTQAALLDAFDHQQYTFGTLLKKLRITRDTSRLPLVSVMFNVDQSVPDGSLGFHALSARTSTNPRHFENFELFANVTQVDGALQIECQYNTGLFDERTVRHWLQDYEALLRHMVEQPHDSVGRTNFLPSAQRELLLDWNATTRADMRDAARHTLVHSIVLGAASRTPQASALHDANTCLSYAQLAARVHRLARALRARGIRCQQRVGLCVRRGADMVVAQLAVLEAGAAYVPLDPAFPADRLSYMAQDAQLALLLTESALAPTLTWPREKSLWLDGDDAPFIDAQPDTALPADAQFDAQPDSPAYVIYTSGSTGKPKGVVVPHRAVVNFLLSMAREPGLSAEDSLVAVTTLSFDIAVLELLLPLSVGAQVRLASHDVAGDGNTLRGLIESSGATVMQATPATWRMLVDAGWRGSPSFKALVGGEALPADLAEQLLKRTGELWNMYGPTETTVWSTCWRVAEPARSISIGRPIANTQVWVLDDQLQACPIGVPGEICIGGEGVSSGYLHRPELTAERFVDDPFAAEPAKLYRTGDRGRWRHDGLLEHLGRLDFQVKVRGYRIELGEIENNLATHPAVARNVVIVREDQPGDVRLVAYFVAEGAQPSAETLRAHLRKNLPEYMLPQHFVALQAIPLLPNGKTDRKSLPAPSRPAEPSTATRTPPATPAEILVAAAMEASLRLPDLSREDNFFSLGGHSLLAAQLAMQLGRTLDRHVPLLTVFEHPTVAALATWLDRDSKEGSAARLVIPRRLENATAPLSLMQQRVLFMENMQPGTALFNTPSGHRLRGLLNEAAFERAVHEVVRRQDALRTVIALNDSGNPCQRIRPDVSFSVFPVQDLSHLPAADREQQLEEQLAALALVPFDLTQGPLFRVRMFRLAPEEHVFFFMAHHIVWDGWSIDVLYNEMSAIYGAYCDGRGHGLPELPVRYGDFAAWHQEWMTGQELASQVGDWKEMLKDIGEPLDLPADRPRPAQQSGAGGTVWLNLPLQTATQLRDLGQRVSATPFMVLLTLYAALIYRMTGRTDLVIGTPVRGRNVSDLEPIMGFFVNALPLRIRLEPAAGMLANVEAVRAAVLRAFKSPDVPFEHLVRELRLPRDESRFPLYQATFSYQDGRSRPTHWGNLKHLPNFVRLGTMAEDFGLGFVEREDGLRGGFNFNADILTGQTVEQIRERFVHIVEQFMARPEATLEQASATPAREIETMRRWNTKAQAFDSGALVLDGFVAQVGKTPQAVALRHAGRSLTYAELHAASNRLANLLRSRGVGRGALVGLCLERSLDLVVAQFAVLLSGAAYVPLDPAYPAERLGYMAGNSRLALLLTESSSAQVLAWPREQSILVDTDTAAIAAQPGGSPAPNSNLDARAEDPAYVIYTSGSTGKPKGVVVPHRSVVNFLSSMGREPGMQEADCLLSVTTLSFDIAVLELLLPLSLGAQVVLAGKEDQRDGAALRACLESNQVNVLQATPSTWRMLIEAGWMGSNSIKALVGGEALPLDLAAELLQRTGELWNMYGPTETTVWSTCWKVASPERGISIGTPIANTSVWVLDECGQVCPVGVPGELCIGGAGLALGYLNQPELSAERFIADPFNPGARLYRTGDRGRWQLDGLLEHLGRLDFQVKVRGFRIELGEIESNLASHSEVARTVVVVREDEPGDVRIVAYVVPRSTMPESQALREHLRATLPDYMVPQHFVRLDSIPLLPNGKINRQSLPTVTDVEINSRALVAPRTDAEIAIAQVWRRLLGIDQLSVTDNFFDLGGHSLLAMKAVSEIERDLGVRIQLRRLIFESLAQVAAIPTSAQTDQRQDAAVSRRGWMGRIMNVLKSSRDSADAPGVRGS